VALAERLRNHRHSPVRVLVVRGRDGSHPIAVEDASPRSWRIYIQRRGKYDRRAGSEFILKARRLLAADDRAALGQIVLQLRGHRLGISWKSYIAPLIA
jgi:hypothetical protein